MTKTMSNIERRALPHLETELHCIRRFFPMTGGVKFYDILSYDAEGVVLGDYIDNGNYRQVRETWDALSGPHKDDLTVILYNGCESEAHNGKYEYDEYR